MGRSWPCTIISGFQLKMAFEKSRETATTLERPVLCMVRVIWRWVVSSAPLTTASVMGSTRRVSLD
jgi:hypothetical protein